MNTFLPYKDFYKCAKCLDDKRLYKQIVECKQIRETLRLKRQGEDVSKRWGNHPAVLMWEGNEAKLRAYQMTMLNEWCDRRWTANLSDMDLYWGVGEKNPLWLGDERLHKSHRAKLYWKDPEHYEQFHDDYLEVTDQIVDDPDNINYEIEPEYYWPIRKL